MSGQKKKQMWTLYALWALCVLMLVGIVHLRRRSALAKQASAAVQSAERVPAAALTPDNSESAPTAAPPTKRAPHPTAPSAPPERAVGNGTYVFSAQDAVAMATLRGALAAAGLQELGYIPDLQLLQVGGDANAMARLLAQLPEGVRAEEDRVVWLPEKDLSAWTGYVGLPVHGELLDLLSIDRQDRKRGEGVLIALLDTPLLAHSSLAGADISSYDLFGLDAQGDYASHGTAVASLLLGQTQELAGIAPAASLLAIPVLSGEGFGSAFQVAEAILVAVAAGAEIISMSLGSYSDSLALRAAVAYADAAGVVLLAATGNDGVAQVCYPAAYDEVIAVAAVNASGTRVGFSNSGEEVDIAAPGLAIYAAGLDDGRELFSGTSAAVPCVSGVLACLLAAEPELTAQNAAALLLAYSNDNGELGADSFYGEGVIAYDRVLARDQPDIYDAAAAAHAPLYDHATEGFLPIQVTAQNRGTETISELQMKVRLGEQESFFVFNDVQVGETVAEVLSIDLAELRDGSQLFLQSSVSIPGVEDAKAQNDTLLSIIHKPQTSKE
jgi:hypothetical protein